ncbi:DUF6181 family protein [Streptomyces mexicanus]|jgi:hypothetical protein|uniref:DUF6181 family protein n=1 Tax=Streptomyces mexicanus TaxID=178566 RepID=UPI0031E83C51
MHSTRNPIPLLPRTARRRGAAQPSKDGVARVTVRLQAHLSASELTRVLIAAPAEYDLAALDPVEIRALVADILTQHGYDVLARMSYDSGNDRHHAARRAIRRAYGHRFTDAPDEQAFLADPLLDTLRSGLRHEGP